MWCGQSCISSWPLMTYWYFLSPITNLSVVIHLHAFFLKFTFIGTLLEWPTHKLHYMSDELESAEIWAPWYTGQALVGWKHLNTGIRRCAKYNLLDFTDPSLPVKCVLRRKLPCSTVNEEGGPRKQSGGTWAHCHSSSFSLSAPKWWGICFHFLKFPECVFWKSREKSRVSLCWLAFTVFLLFQICYLCPFSSSHSARHASVGDLVLAACWWVCPHVVHQGCQVKSCNLLLCIAEYSLLMLDKWVLFKYLKMRIDLNEEFIK